MQVTLTVTLTPADDSVLNTTSVTQAGVDIVAGRLVEYLESRSGEILLTTCNGARLQLTDVRVVNLED